MGDHLSSLLYPEMKDMADEVNKQFRSELDFEHEYQNLQLVCFIFSFPCVRLHDLIETLAADASKAGAREGRGGTGAHPWDQPHGGHDVPAGQQVAPTSL
jgi:hypothetical protein